MAEQKRPQDVSSLNKPVSFRSPDAAGGRKLINTISRTRSSAPHNSYTYMGVNNNTPLFIVLWGKMAASIFFFLSTLQPSYISSRIPPSWIGYNI